MAPALRGRTDFGRGDRSTQLIGLGCLSSSHRRAAEGGKQQAVAVAAAPAPSWDKGGEEGHQNVLSRCLHFPPRCLYPGAPQQFPLGPSLDWPHVLLSLQRLADPGPGKFGSIPFYPFCLAFFINLDNPGWRWCIVLF